MSGERRWFWFVLMSLTFLRLAYIGQFDLCPDEAYYWTWSRHIDWAYFDQGPMIALVIRFFTWITHTNTEWSVRLGAVVFSCISGWMFFEMVNRMFDDGKTAWMAFLTMQTSLLFSAGSVLMMHDSIMVCFWIASLFLFYLAFFEDWIPGLYLGALTMGLGALCKYSMAFFAPCLLLFLVFSPTHRKWLGIKHLYFAGALTLICISPLLIWNAKHGSVSYSHIAILSGANEQLSLSLKTVGDFFAGQLGLLTPILGLLSFASLGVAWRRWYSDRQNSEKHLFLLAFSAPILLFFLILSFHKSVYANWPAPAYIATFALLGDWVRKHNYSGSTLRQWFRVALITGACLTLLVHLEVAFGILPLQGSAAVSVGRVWGWKSMGEEAGKRIEEMNSISADPVFLAARRYQIAAELSFYLPGQPEVELIPETPEATNQYRFWNHQKEKYGQTALYVCDDGGKIDHLERRFERIMKQSGFPIRKKGEIIREILFYTAKDFQSPLDSTADRCEIVCSDRDERLLE